MSEQKFNQQAVTQYLLGALPESERVRLDELSVTDDEFADALGVAEKDLVDAYVQGELSEAELGQFKSYYLASSLRRQKVEFAEAFRAWSEKEAIEDVAQVGPEEHSEKHRQGRWLSGLSIFRTPQFALGLAAATLAMFVAAGLLSFIRICVSVNR